MATMTNKRYGVYNRNTAAKTGEAKITKQFTTREQARTWKRKKNFTYGIYDMSTGNFIR